MPHIYIAVSRGAMRCSYRRAWDLCVRVRTLVSGLRHVRCAVGIKVGFESSGGVIPRWEIKVRFPSSGEPQRRGVTHVCSSHARWRERGRQDTACIEQIVLCRVYADMPFPCRKTQLSPAYSATGRDGTTRCVTHTRALNARDCNCSQELCCLPVCARVACAKLRAWLFFPRLPSLPAAAIYEFILFFSLPLSLSSLPRDNDRVL